MVDSCLESDPTNITAIYLAGLVSYYKGHLDEGLKYFERAIKMDPNHHKSKTMQLQAKNLQEKEENGHKAFNAGNLHEAQKMCTEALQIDPLNVNFNSTLYYNRALMESKMGNNTNAIADCTSALDGNPNLFRALVLRAKCHIRMDKYETCINDCEAALKIKKSRRVQQALIDVKKIWKWFESKNN